MTAAADPSLGSSSPPPRFLARRVTALGGVAVFGLGALYLGTVAFASSDVPAGTTVLGVGIGGLSRDDAIATLTTGSTKAVKADLDVTVATAHLTVDPASAGLSLDAAATVDSITGREWNPFALLGRIGASANVAPVVAVDRATLDTRITAIAADTDAPAQEPAIRFRDGAPRLTDGEPGQVLDQQAAGDALAAAYLQARSVLLPTTVVAPTVSADAAASALSGALTATTEPVTVRVDTVSATLSPQVLRTALTYIPKDGALVAALDGSVLRAAVAPRVATVETPGRDATWKIRAGRPVIVASKVGRGVNAEQLAVAVAGVLDKSGPARTVTAPIGTIDPKLTTQAAQALRVTERLSTFTQRYPYAAYRSQNIGQAAKYVNGTLLRPGDGFSMNDVIKERTVANGYTKGFVVGAGGVFKEDLGGGVSTATTATWTAAFFAGLQRVHTQAHSIWISRYQPGLEATVAWGFFDMQFRNDTKDGVFITASTTPTSITVSIWGTKVYDRITDLSSARTNTVPFKTLYDTSADCRSQSGVSGFDITVTRQFNKAGKVVRSEPIRTHYAPSPLVLCREDPAKVKPTPVPPGASPSPGAPGTPTASPKPAKPAAAPRPTKTRS